MRDMDISHGHGFMLVYSITSDSTFYELEPVRKQIEQVKGTKTIPMILVGT
jgi:hypothetical protein